MTPDNATSPMDSSSTVRIPRETVRKADRDELDPESTVVIPHAADDTGVTWPQEDESGRSQHQRTQQPDPSDGDPPAAMPPNPYQGRRGPGEFGPLGSQAAEQYPYSW